MWLWKIEAELTRWVNERVIEVEVPQRVLGSFHLSSEPFSISLQLSANKSLANNDKPKLLLHETPAFDRQFAANFIYFFHFSLNCEIKQISSASELRSFLLSSADSSLNAIDRYLLRSWNNNFNRHKQRLRSWLWNGQNPFYCFRFYEWRFAISMRRLEHAQLSLSWMIHGEPWRISSSLDVHLNLR